MRQKILAVFLVIFLMCGVIILNVNSESAEEEPSSLGPRADADPLVNDFGPNVTVTLGDGSVITVLNNNSYFVLIVIVDDEDEIYNMSFENGTKIASVTIDLTSLGGLSDTAMTYEGNNNLPSFYNYSHVEGWYTILLDLTSVAAGDYWVNVTATDSGENTSGWLAKSTTVPFMIKVGQHNRPPKIRDGAPTYFESNEDEWIKDPLLINLNDTIFYDADVAEGPFDNTDKDRLTFEIWDPWTWSWYDTESSEFVFGIYDNVIIGSGSDMYEYVMIMGFENSSTNGSISISVGTYDNLGEKRIHNFTITIWSVNDAPVIESADNWKYNNENASSNDGRTIKCTQGQEVDLTVTATDIENDTLTFGLDGFDLSRIQADIDPFSIQGDGRIKFTPQNEHVGSFNVTISVSDNFNMDTETYTFKVIDANDPPKIKSVSVNGESQSIDFVKKEVALSASQGAEFIMEITAEDPDPGDTLTFSAGVLSLNKVDNRTVSYTFTPTNADVGTKLIKFTVKDNADSSDYIIANITVANANDPPRITKVDGSIPPKNKIIDMTNEPLTKTKINVTLTIEAEDIDFDTPDDEDLTWLSSSGGVDFMETTKTKVEVTIDGEDLGDGTHEINISVNDMYGLKDWIVVKVKVEKVVNNPPVLSQGKMEPATGDTETTFTFSVHYYDVDGDAPDIITVMIDGNSYNMLLKSGEDATNGVYEYKIKLSEGTHTYSFFASDGISEPSPFPEKTTPEITKANGPSNGNGDKEGETNWTIYIVLVVVVIIILIVLFLVVMRLKKSKKEPEHEREPEHEPELEPEPDHGPEDKPYYGSGYEDYDRDKYSKGYDEPEYRPDIEKDIYDDQYTKPVKGKMPTPVKYEPYKAPDKGKFPEPVEDFGVEEGPAVAGNPTVIRLEDRSLPCGICLGTIKTGLIAVKCTCGKVYHDSCALRVLECPRCDTKFEEGYLRDMIDQKQAPEAEFEIDEAFAEEEPPMPLAEEEDEDEWEPEAGPEPQKGGEPVDWDKGEEEELPSEAGQVCPSCGAETEGKRFCGECGERLD